MLDRPSSSIDGRMRSVNKNTKLTLRGVLQTSAAAKVSKAKTVKKAYKAKAASKAKAAGKDKVAKVTPPKEVVQMNCQSTESEKRSCPDSTTNGTKKTRVEL